MKRLLIAFLFTVALLGLLAAPAVAGKHVPTVRPPVGVPIIWALDGGWWYEYSGVTGTIDDVIAQQASERTGRDRRWFVPVPANTLIRASCGWVGIDYGAVSNCANQIDTTVVITGPGGFSRTFTPEQVKPYWTGPFLYDQYWTDAGGPPPAPFNPAIGAAAYRNELFLPLGSFPTAGWYLFSMTVEQVLPVNDLTAYGEWGPTHFAPGATDFANEFAFYVE